MTKKPAFDKIIQELEENPAIKKLPPEIRKAVRERIESMANIDFPIVTLSDDGWFIAQTPVLDLCAQGKNENEAVKNLKAMINDWMSDPDTPKPKIEKIMKMQIGIKTISVKVPIISNDCYEPIKHVA